MLTSSLSFSWQIKGDDFDAFISTIDFVIAGGQHRPDSVQLVSMSQEIWAGALLQLSMQVNK